MWNNLWALKMKNILTMYTNSTQCFMGLNKHQEYGINVLEIYSLKMILGLVMRILLSSLEK
jgi:hypothetical protein